MWIFLLFSLLFWLFPPYPCLHTNNHTPFSAGSLRPATCCSEVSVGFLAAVQGPVSSPFPSLHLLAQISAATLGLAGGTCSALKWVVCEGVGIPCVLCSLASGSALALGAAVWAAKLEPAGGTCAWRADSHWAEAALWGACHFLLPRVKVIMLWHFPSSLLSFSHLLSFPRSSTGFLDPRLGACQGRHNIF